MVYRGGLGSHPLTVVPKYLLQAIETVGILFRERPGAAFVMSPPVFAPLVVALVCVLRGIPFVIDAHSSAFLDRRWRHFQGLQAWLCRKAATTIVHNPTLASRVRALGAHATLVPDVPIEFGRGHFPITASFSAAAACSFNHDEPVAELVDAARRMPHVQLFITGDAERMARSLRASLPPNVILTGFLSTGDYGALFSGVDVVIALTTRPATMLRSAYEAIYAGTPVIVSDSDVLRAAFPMGAVHVVNDGPAIAAALETIRSDGARYRARARELREVMRARWSATRAAIMDALTASGARA